MPEYVHKFSNQAIFDMVRSMQINADVLAGYLSYVGGCSKEVEALHSVSTLLFDDVYKGLRSHWQTD